ncbi:MAG: isoprenyl transferase [Deltaproteobacteria bacterium]|nr:isoprenyl transferase [Deltaproteobacteria bacterium]
MTRSAALPDDLRDTPVPAHVAIIMDGNGRWARERGLPRVAGHREGAESVRDVVRACRQIGVRALTLFAFSAQNWQRPDDEVQALMELLGRYVIEERGEIMDNGIRLTAIGEVERLPGFVRQPLAMLMDDSAKNSEMALCLALSYGAREDLVRAVRDLAQQVVDGKRAIEQIDEQLISSALWTHELPPLDLLIRTSGELRISNFLLWELAYSELYFTDVSWPDFRRAHLFDALRAYHQRERRFGRTSSQLSDDSSKTDE